MKLLRHMFCTNVDSLDIYKSYFAQMQTQIDRNIFDERLNHRDTEDMERMDISMVPKTVGRAGKNTSAFGREKCCLCPLCASVVNPRVKI